MKKFFRAYLVWVLLGLLVLLCVLARLEKGSSLSDFFLFARRFIERPKAVGAVAPSSRLLAEALSAYIKPGTALCSYRYLEVGPGTGAVTQEIVSCLGANDRLDLVELDEELANELRKKYAGNAQVQVISGSITQWKPDYLYDGIVMGVPFNALPLSLVREIWEHVRALIADGGVISYFSYLGLAHIKKALLSKEDKKEFKKSLRYLQQLCADYSIGKRKVWANIPPAVVRYLCFMQPVSAY